MKQEAYFKEVGKKLYCAKEKKASILEDLQADVREAMEQGETWEQIMERMGTPKELASELNENLDTEGKKPGRRKVLPVILGVTAVILVLLIAAGVYVYHSLPKSYEIGKSGLFDAQTVETSAEEVIGLLDAGEYETLKERSIDAMKDALNPETMEGARAQVGENWGDFQKFTSSLAVEVKQGDQWFATTEVTALYEERSVIYRITFDEEMKLAGIYMR